MDDRAKPCLETGLFGSLAGEKGDLFGIFAQSRAVRNTEIGFIALLGEVERDKRGIRSNRS